MEELDEQLLCFDLRYLALQKLKTAKKKSNFITYKQARCVLGRSLHLTKVQSRQLILRMSEDNLLSINCKGKIKISEDSND